MMMSAVIRQMEVLKKREYRAVCRQGVEDLTHILKSESLQLRSAERFAYVLDREEPVFHGEDLFGFNRYWAAYPKDDRSGGGGLGNLTADYETALALGMNGVARRARALQVGADAKTQEFYDSVCMCMEACERLTRRYREKAAQQGHIRLAKALERVPMEGARDYYEALITMRFMQYALRLSRMVHVTLGRFDQYMYPYYKASVASGATDEEILELTELFFIAMNFDTDIYHGVQQGDNGQSMVLGGCLKDGSDAFNELSEICLQASEDLKIIDPKINLRVSSKTPQSLYERGTRLTKQGLGFPQYSNDDVVIPGLIGLGYDPEDAWNYTVAACWEFIIPRSGADVPNIEVMNFPLVVDRAVRKYLPDCADLDTLLAHVRDEIEAECDHIEQICSEIQYGRPNPFLSAFVQPCLDRGRDVTNGGAKYNNYGIHGAGIANAADALAAIRTEVFERRSSTAEELIRALDDNFAGHEELQRRLLACPKMGNNEEEVDELGDFLMEAFARAMNGRPNPRGGIYRAGTGSAMEYIFRAKAVGATADGRPAYEPYGSSFSPSLHARLNGPLSAVQSFSRFDMKKIVNGGPFTIEIHDTVFRNEEGEKKVAQLIKTFIDLGGHQIQINAVNRDTLLDAQRHPEKYPNLIVRVWGWSGYFNELDVAFQDHVIRRMEFGL